MQKSVQNIKFAASAKKSRARNIILMKAFAVVLAVGASFALGFMIRGNDALMAQLGVGHDLKAASTTAAESTTYNSVGARLSEVEKVIADDSLDTYDLDDATSKVMEAFADSTADKSLRYYSINRYAALSQDSSTSYAGIGVLFGEYNGKAYAVDVFDGSEAQEADVQEGDFVVAINSDRSQQWSSTEVTAAIKAAAGQEIVITWRRASTLEDEGGNEFTTTLNCNDFTVKNVTTELGDDKVGYIQLKQITSNAATLVDSAIEDLTNQGAQAFVLDIRDNPGGYLTQSVDVASLFVKSGTIVRIQTKDNEETTKNATGEVATDLPLVVLVNANTASSAEVLAAALQDNQRATIVGDTTMGKGTVQVTRDLSFGGALRYTAAYYKSPLGHDIDGLGVVPDVSLSLASDSDNQKSVALETAQSLIKE